MISVIMPVDCRVAYFTQALESVLTQTERDFELFCVLDGETAARSTAVAVQVRSPCVRLLQIEQSGPGAARNAGLDAAKGEYIAFCDSDDILPPRALEYLLRRMNCGVPDIVMGSFLEQFDSGNAVLCEVNSADNGFGRFFSYVSVWNRLYRRDFLERYALRFPAVSQGEDLLFLADAFLAKPKVAVARQVVYQWQRHETDRKKTLTHATELEGFLQLMDSWERFFEKMFPLFPDETQAYGRDSCPYLLSRLSNIRSFTQQSVAMEHLLHLACHMDWERYPLRFAKIFHIQLEAFRRQFSKHSNVAQRSIALP